ncbi:CvpA family protein [Azohydromonas caseinilytica]|uniref:CvpA family protein n=1 Tax=Azohydromonas caseinilytica TaxID=2728836 RepID=UPI002873573E|nr:CvpA family protein [Azohydromonas caseinilytica]
MDVLLGLIVLLGMWSGWRRGFIVAALELLCLVAALVAALWGYARVAAGLEPHLESAWARPLAFVGLFAVVRIVLGVLVLRRAHALPRQAHAHGANRALGLLPGAGSGLIDAMLAVMLLLALPLADGLTEATRDSRLAQRLVVPAEWVEARLAPIFNEAASRTLNRLTIQPESRERIALPFSVQNPRPRPELEARMLDLVNEARAREGLKPLRADPEAAGVARAHSHDMFARAYFSHISPEGADPFDRMRRGGLRFVMAGENLALAQTLELAHRGLMESPGHRANILRPGFGRVGIGILDGGRRGLMVTQNFRN